MSVDSDDHRLARDMIEMHGAIAAANPAGIEAGIRTRTVSCKFNLDRGRRGTRRAIPTGVKRRRRSRPMMP